MKTLLVLLFTFSFIQSVYSVKNDLTSICTRPGTSEMYIGGEFKTILVVDKKTGSELRRLTHGKGARDMQFSPDGKKLIVFDGQRALLLGNRSRGPNPLCLPVEVRVAYDKDPWIPHRH